MDKVTQYDLLSRLEQETTRLRYTTFTALISVSFLLPGLAFTSPTGESVSVFGTHIRVSALGFLLGFFFYLFTIVHYAWYHRYAHRYRAALKELEIDLGIKIYRLRTRPSLGRMKFHFDWFLYILGAAYFALTAAYAGFTITVVAVGTFAIAYLVLLIWSITWDVEPLENGRH